VVTDGEVALVGLQLAIVSQLDADKARLLAAGHIGATVISALEKDGDLFYVIDF